MPVMDEADQRNCLDLLRRSDFNDAALLLNKMLVAAHSVGVLEGGKDMADTVLARMETPAPNPAPRLEEEIRQTVLEKFRRRGDLPGDAP